MPEKKLQVEKSLRGPASNPFQTKDLESSWYGPYWTLLDLIGPLLATQCDNKCIVTLTGYFSKWAKAAPLPDKTALGVAKFIYSVSCVCNV